MLKRQARAAEYHGRALDASALAVASPLDRVRERHEAAAARWRALAALSERVAPVPVVRSPAAGQEVGPEVPDRNGEGTPCIA